MKPDEVGNTEKLILSNSAFDGPQKRYGYRVAGWRFMVPDGTSSELLMNSKVFDLPKSPDWLHGLINLRGNIIPVANVANLLGDESEEVDASKVLVIGKGDTAVGLLVNDLPEALSQLEQELELSDIPEALREFSSKAYMCEAKKWYEFDVHEYLRHQRSSLS